MSTSKITSLILAGGKGTRLGSETPKVLHSLCGQPLLFYPVDLAQTVSNQTIVVFSPQVLSHYRTNALSHQAPVIQAIQETPKGTGDAVKAGLQSLKSNPDTILVLNGDMPLLKKETLSDFIKEHQKSNATVSLMTSVIDNPAHYGRILRKNDSVTGIVEFKDANETQKKIKEINIGVYLFDFEFLTKALKKLKPENAQKEYYLTDVISFAVSEKKKIFGFKLKDNAEGLGVNTQEELSSLENFMMNQKIKKLMEKGVRFIKPELVTIENDVVIEADTTIYGPSTFLGKTKIGKNCIVEPNTLIRDSEIGDKVTIKASTYIDGSLVESHCNIGPMAHLRPGSHLKNEVKVGNFVEIKKSTIGEKSKVNHLSYIGDATIGKEVNIGAGTITCNYDGKKKHQTVIEDGVFVGSDTQFVAPVRIGRKAFIGAGSTITKNVSAESLGLSRTKQKEIKGWVKKKS